MKAAGEPTRVPDACPVARAATPNAAMVSAVMASDFSMLSRAPAEEVTTQPTAIAVPNGPSPASAPPAAAITASAPT